MSERLQSLCKSLQGRRLLITGASGRIGTRFLEILLKAGVQPRALYRRLPEQGREGLHAVEGDLLNPAALELALQGVDVVVHLASYAPAATDPDPEEHPRHRQVTVEGTRNLLAAAQRAGVGRLVFASSTRVIDGSGSLYARSKRQAEALVLGAGDSMEVVVLRLAPVYGFPRQGGIAQMIAAIDQGRFPSLPDFADQRSLVHVDDVLQALVLAATHAQAAGQVFTVTDLRVYSSRELYELISRALGRKPAPSRIPVWLLSMGARAGDLLQILLRCPMPLNRERLQKLRSSACFDAEPLVRELGYQPQHDLQNSLPEITRAYRSKP
jgi:nucleoside-diphosphate-sugar epimerase